MKGPIGLAVRMVGRASAHGTARAAQSDPRNGTHARPPAVECPTACLTGAQPTPKSQSAFRHGSTRVTTRSAAPPGNPRPERSLDDHPAIPFTSATNACPSLAGERVAMYNKRQTPRWSSSPPGCTSRSLPVETTPHGRTPTPPPSSTWPQASPDGPNPVPRLCPPQPSAASVGSTGWSVSGGPAVS